MKRRPKGQGCIVKTGDTYYGRIVRHGKASVIKLSKNQRESEGLWKKWLDGHRDSPAKDSAVHSLDDAWARLLSSCHARSASDSVIDNKRRLFVRFRDWMTDKGKLNLEDIDTDDIVLCMAEISKGSSTGFQRNLISVIRGLWENSLPDEKNPAENVKPKFVETTSREALTDEEVSKLLDEAAKCKNGEELVGIIKVSLYTGLRLKDCVFLSTKNVKGDVIQLTPRKTVKREILVRIPMHPELKKCLEELTPDEHGHYFPKLVGIYNTGSMCEALRRLFKRCFETSRVGHGGIRMVPVKTFHSLRATFITRLAERGVSLPIMESLAGHLNPKQTMHYAHPDEDVKKAAVEVLSFGNDVDEKIFMHPDVKRLMDEFEKQKQEFLAKIEEKINELTGQKRDIGTVEKPSPDDVEGLLARFDNEDAGKYADANGNALRSRILKDVLRRVGMQL